MMRPLLRTRLGLVLGLRGLSILSGFLLGTLRGIGLSLLYRVAEMSVAVDVVSFGPESLA